MPVQNNKIPRKNLTDRAKNIIDEENPKNILSY